MADLSQLGNLQSTDPLDLPLYQARGTSRPFPLADRYTARTPESFPPESFGESKAGFLTVDVSPTIVGGDYDGYKINYTRVSAKTWKNKEGITESQLGRYLKATGVDGVVGGTPQEQADAAEASANKLVSIDADWIARHRESGFELKGMKNFPVVDGKPSRFVKLDGTNGRPLVETVNQVTGETEPLTIRAFLEVTRFSPITQ